MAPIFRPCRCPAPLRGLDAASADYVARLCTEASAHSRVLLSADFASSPGPERNLLSACDELLVRRQGELIASGTPSSVFALGTRYSLSVKGPRIADFSRVLGEAGVRLEARDQAGRFSVELPQANANTDLLLDAALDHDLIVLELEPLFAV